MCLVVSSRVMARVAWKPLVPGMTTSISMRSGFSDFDLMIASSPFSAVTHWYPCLDSVSMKNCRSVGESSTIKIFFTAMAISSGANGRVRAYGFQKTILRKWLGQIFVRAHHSAARPIKKAVLGRQHDHGGGGEVCVFLDQRAGLIPVQARHHDVHENDIGLVVGDLGERVETVFGEDHLATGLNQKNLSAAANRVRIVDHHHFDARKTRAFAHALHPQISLCLLLRQRCRTLFTQRRWRAERSFLRHYTTKSSQNKALCVLFQKHYQGGKHRATAVLGRAPPRSRERARLHFDHLEILLPGPAFRASPIHRDVLPARPRRDPFLR